MNLVLKKSIIYLISKVPGVSELIVIITLFSVVSLMAICVIMIAWCGFWIIKTCYFLPRYRFSKSNHGWVKRKVKKAWA